MWFNVIDKNQEQVLIRYKNVNSNQVIKMVRQLIADNKRTIELNVIVTDVYRIVNKINPSNSSTLATWVT